MPKRRRRSFTPQFKAQVVLEVLSGTKSQAEVARQRKLKPELIARWRDIALEGLPSRYRAVGYRGRGPDRENIRPQARDKVERILPRSREGPAEGWPEPRAAEPLGAHQRTDEGTMDLTFPFGLTVTRIKELPAMFRPIARSWGRLVLLAALVVAISPSSDAVAQKGKPGGGGGPVPPGTIYYVYGSDIWGMKADGSGKSVALPGYAEAYPVLPSSLAYGNDTHRLWLGAETVPGQFYPYFPDPTQNTVEQRELFAYRRGPAGGVQKVQITDLFPGIQVEHNEPGSCQWSNDGADTFVSFKGIDARVYFLTGNLADVRAGIFRIRISGADIDAAADAGSDLLLGEESLEEVASVTDPKASALLHAWSPDGNQVAFTLRDPNFNVDLWIRDIPSGLTGPLWDSGSNPYVPHFRWSPAGGKIVMTQATGSVWTIDAGTGALIQTVLQSSGSTSYSTPYWSPDAAQLVIRETQSKPSGTTRFISRLPSAGGSLTRLSSDLSASSQKFPIGWVSDALAAP